MHKERNVCTYVANDIYDSHEVASNPAEHDADDFANIWLCFRQIANKQ